MSSTFGLGFGPSAPPSIRSKARSNFSGFKLFWVSFLEPELGPGSYERQPNPLEPLKIFQLYSSLVYPIFFQGLLSLTKSSRVVQRFEPGQYRVLGLFSASFSSGPGLRAGSGTCSSSNLVQISVLRWKKAIYSMSPYRRHYFSEKKQYVSYLS